MDEQSVQRLQRTLLDVLVRAVHRLLALEAHDGCPAECRKRARASAGSSRYASKPRSGGRSIRSTLPASRTSPRVSWYCAPGCRGSSVPYDEPGLLAPVIGEARLEVQDAERLLPRRDQRDVLALMQRVGGSPPNRERDREWPREPVGKAHPFQDRPVVGLAEEPLEGAVRADGEELEIGHHPGVERDPVSEAARARASSRASPRRTRSINRPP